tara:strand:+ start:2249 stop:2923 length:675 start_codon:yes stop_codon:yes gene_type:complete
MIKNKIPISIFLNMFVIVGLIIVSSSIKNNIKLPELKIDPELDEINFHEDFYKVVNIGQKRMISSLLWTHTLLFGDIEHIKKKDSFSWMYYRFNGISLIDPLFYENYFLGGQYIGVVKDDVLGSTKLFKRGLDKFPLDIELNFNLGFNYLFYTKEIEKGVVYWKKILAMDNISEKKPLLPIRIINFLKNKEDKLWSVSILKDLAEKNKGTPIGDAYKRKLKKYQ